MWQTTPRMLRALWDRRRLEYRRVDLLAGIVAATVANFAGKALKEGHSVRPADMVPWLESDGEHEERMTPEETGAYLDGIFGITAGPGDGGDSRPDESGLNEEAI